MASHSAPATGEAVQYHYDEGGNVVPFRPTPPVWHAVQSPWTFSLSLRGLRPLSFRSSKTHALTCELLHIVNRTRTHSHMRGVQSMLLLEGGGAAVCSELTSDSVSAVFLRLLQPAPQAPVEPYCWEEGGDEDAPPMKRLGHTLHWAGSSVVSGMAAGFS